VTAPPRPHASVVVPALNEAGNVAALMDEVRAVAADPALPVEIVEVVLVDNGSTDGTPEVARVAGAVVVAAPERGYGRACLAGALAARGELLVYMDGDRSEVPAELPRLLEPFLSGAADLVIGSRVLGRAEPGALSPQQRAGNRAATMLVRRLFGVRVTDLGPYRVIGRDALLDLRMRERTYGWPVEMICRAAARGLRVQEVPVTCRRRVAGVSKVGGDPRASIRAGWKIALTILACWWRLRGAR
jgi:glycosyltransferase involved in cell wall biosynthesis